MFSAIARIIFLIFSAWFLVPFGKAFNFVTPSTRVATVSPKLYFISAIGINVSSTTSCKSPATIVSVSIFISIKIFATSTGWTI